MKTNSDDQKTENIQNDKNPISVDGNGGTEESLMPEGLITTDDEIKAIAVALFHERIFTSSMIPENMPISTFFAPLKFMNEEQFNQVQKQAAMLYEYKTKSKHQIDGVPVFSSFRIITHEALPKVEKEYNELTRRANIILNTYKNTEQEKTNTMDKKYEELQNEYKALQKSQRFAKFLQKVLVGLLLIFTVSTAIWYFTSKTKGTDSSNGLVITGDGV